MSARQMLAHGAFNHMSQVTQADGSVLVTLTRRGDPHRYTMLVRNLYRPDEQVLWERTEPQDSPPTS